MPSEAYEGWAIVELMGHRRLGGRICQVEQYGIPMLRIDVPAADGREKYSTQFYSGPAIYCMTPTSEEVARRLAVVVQPTPINQWELPAAPADADPEYDPEDPDMHRDPDDCQPG